MKIRAFSWVSRHLQLLGRHPSCLLTLPMIHRKHSSRSDTQATPSLASPGSAPLTDLAAVNRRSPTSPTSSITSTTGRHKRRLRVQWRARVNKRLLRPRAWMPLVNNNRNRGHLVEGRLKSIQTCRLICTMLRGRLDLIRTPSVPLRLSQAKKATWVRMARRELASPLATRSGQTPALVAGPTTSNSVRVSNVTTRHLPAQAQQPCSNRRIMG